MINSPSMFDEFNCTGYWWPPGHEHLRRAGTVTFTPGSDIALELLDVPEFPESPKIFWGEVSSHPSMITLANCTRTASRVFSPRQSNGALLVYRAEYIIAGCWRESLDDAVLKCAQVSFSGLREWLGSGISWSTDAEGDEWVVRYKRHLPPLHLFPVYSDRDALVSFGEFVSSTHNCVEETLYLQKENFIDIFPWNSPVDIRWFVDEFCSIRDLLAFLTGMKPQVKKIQGRLADNDLASNSPADIDLFFNAGPTTEIERYNDVSFSVPFSFENLGKDVTSKVFQAWFAKRDRYRTSITLFLSVVYGEHRTGEAQFLTLIQSLDSFFQTKFDRDGAYTRECLKGLRDSLPERLQEIVELTDAFIKRIVCARNYYVHRNNEKEKSDLGPALNNGTKRLTLLFAAVFASEIRLPESVIQNALEKAASNHSWQSPVFDPLQ